MASVESAPDFDCSIAENHRCVAIAAGALNHLGELVRRIEPAFHSTYLAVPPRNIDPHGVHLEMTDIGESGKLIFEGHHLA